MQLWVVFFFFWPDGNNFVDIPIISCKKLLLVAETSDLQRFAYQNTPNPSQSLLCKYSLENL